MKHKKSRKTVLFLLLLFVCGMLCSCSAIKGAMKKIPLFEDADVDSLAEKAEKAWDEVGKDALKDAAGSAAGSIFGDTPALSWPQSEAMKDIPPVQTGTISKISEKTSIIEITVKEVSLSGYDEYFKLLTETFGKQIADGIFRLDNRLISAIYDEENTTLVITVSVVKQTIN